MPAVPKHRQPIINAAVTLFRRQGFPVLYPYVSPKESFDGGRLAEQVPALMQVPMAGYEFVNADY